MLRPPSITNKTRTIEQVYNKQQNVQWMQPQRKRQKENAFGEINPSQSNFTSQNNQSMQDLPPLNAQTKVKPTLAGNVTTTTTNTCKVSLPSISAKMSPNYNQYNVQSNQNYTNHSHQETVTPKTFSNPIMKQAKAQSATNQTFQSGDYNTKSNQYAMPPISECCAMCPPQPINNCYCNSQGASCNSIVPKTDNVQSNSISYGKALDACACINCKQNVGSSSYNTQTNYTQTNYTPTTLNYYTDSPSTLADSITYDPMVDYYNDNVSGFGKENYSQYI